MTDTDHLDSDRRLRMMTLPAEQVRILGNLMGRWFRLSELPTDAEIVNISYRVDTNEWAVLIRSDEFPAIPRGAIIPCIDLKIETKEGL